MLIWLLLGTIVYLVTLYVPSLFLVSGIGMVGYLGSRDNEQIESALHGRAQRAARNFQENFPVFMGLGILTQVIEGADLGLAAAGAMVFVIARIAYLLLYMGGVAYVRSLAFMIGWAGMIAMALALI